MTTERPSLTALAAYLESQCRGEIEVSVKEPDILLVRYATGEARNRSEDLQYRVRTFVEEKYQIVETTYPDSSGFRLRVM